MKARNNKTGNKTLRLISACDKKALTTCMLGKISV